MKAPVLGKEILYLSKKEIEDMQLPMEEMIDIVEEVFREKAEGRYQMPAKIALHPLEDRGDPNDFIHAMPAFLSGPNISGIKIVSGFVNATRQGFPYINGVYILIDPDTGIPIAVMDSIWVTAVRTGAVTGLTAKYLGNPDSEVLGILGTGVQGRNTLDAVACTMKNLKEVRVYDKFPGSAERFVAAMSAKYPQYTFKVVDKEDAVRGCDLLGSCIPINIDPNEEFISDDMIKEGATCIAVDLQVLYKPECFGSPIWDVRTTDDIGQYDTFHGTGYMRGFDGTPPEMGHVIAGKVPGRTDPSQRIMTTNIGLGLCDLGVAKRVFDEALARNVGRILPL